jgi:hypothetical protein
MTTRRSLSVCITVVVVDAALASRSGSSRNRMSLPTPTGQLIPLLKHSAARSTNAASARSDTQATTLIVPEAV